MGDGDETSGAGRIAQGGASLVLLAGAGVGMPEAVDLPCQEALRLRNNRSLTELLLGSQ